MNTNKREQDAQSTSRNAQHGALRQCLREPHDRLKTPQNMNEKRSAILHSRIRALAERRVYIGVAIHAKSCGRDSDDRVRLPLQNKVLPDRFFASAEAALTQNVTDER